MQFASSSLLANCTKSGPEAYFGYENFMTVFTSIGHIELFSLPDYNFSLVSDICPENYPFNLDFPINGAEVFIVRPNDSTNLLKVFS